ncbi:MAG TPA: hypothetical protein VKT54_11790, partial [Steroidobacteraceae bacterium]|nr:hypothetical protein [Steroidobacteraceae bacterium]
MSKVRTMQRLWLAVGAIALAACGQGGKPAAPAAAAAAGTAAAAEGPRIATSDDLVHLEYQVYGQGEPAVLLIHGWCGNAAYWHAQIEALR